MITKYHTKLSQKDTYLRVYEGERMLQAEEVTDVIKGFEERIAELEKERDEANCHAYYILDTCTVFSPVNLQAHNLEQQLRILKEYANICRVLQQEPSTRSLHEFIIDLEAKALKSDNDD